MGVSIKGAVNSLKSSTNILLLELFTSQNLILNMGNSNSSLLKDRCLQFLFHLASLLLSREKAVSYRRFSPFHLAVSIIYFHSNIIVTLTIHSSQHTFVTFNNNSTKYCTYKNNS